MTLSSEDVLGSSASKSTLLDVGREARSGGKGESRIAGRQAADPTLLPALAFAWTSPGYSLRVGMESQDKIGLVPNV